MADNTMSGQYKEHYEDLGGNNIMLGLKTYF